MSNYRPDEGPSTESLNSSPRSPPSRYRINPPTLNGHALGSHTPSTYASSSRVPASIDSTNGLNDHNFWRTSVLPSPPQHSADLQWDMSGRPLDRPRSRQPSDYGSPLPTSNVDWISTNKYAETQQPQPLPQVNDQQRRLAPAAISGTARQAQAHYVPPLPHLTASPVPVPEGAVGVVKEVTLETQPVATEKRVPFTKAIQPPVTAIHATATQASAALDQGHTVTLNQLKTIKGRRSNESNQPEQSLFVSRNGNSTLPMLKVEREGSFRRSFNRAGRKVSKGFLDALRLGTEPPVVFRADTILSEWNTYLFQFNEKHTEMEEAFDPFQDQIEDAFDAKYQELLGEGKFLIDDKEETELLAEVPVELPVQIVQVVPTEVAGTWIAHKKAEEAATEVRDVYTGSVRRRLPASELVVHPPKPRTYSAGPPPPATVPQPLELQPVVKPERMEDDPHPSTPHPVDNTQPIQAETEAKAEQPNTPSPSAKERHSRLPRPSSNRSSRSMSRQRPTGRRSSAAQPVEEPKSQTPSKARKDSAQTGFPTKPAVPPRAQSRDQERYPKVRNMKK